MKIVTTFKYLIFIPTVALLCFPLNLRSKHFSETVILAPVIDQVLKEVPEYEFIVYHQDAAALLFYSQQLTRVKIIEDKKLLEEELAKSVLTPRFCYLSEKDYNLLSPAVKDNFRVILKYRNNLILGNIKAAKIIVTLPE